MPKSSTPVIDTTKERGQKLTSLGEKVTQMAANAAAFEASAKEKLAQVQGKANTGAAPTAPSSSVVATAPAASSTSAFQSTLRKRVSFAPVDASATTSISSPTSSLGSPASGMLSASSDSSDDEAAKRQLAEIPQRMAVAQALLNEVKAERAQQEELPPVEKLFSAPAAAKPVVSSFFQPKQSYGNWFWSFFSCTNNKNKPTARTNQSSWWKWLTSGCGLFSSCMKSHKQKPTSTSAFGRRIGG